MLGRELLGGVAVVAVLLDSTALLPGVPTTSLAARVAAAPDATAAGPTGYHVSTQVLLSLAKENLASGGSRIMVASSSGPGTYC